jgi:predicted CXXCH cytochrome family protein
MITRRRWIISGLLVAGIALLVAAVWLATPSVAQGQDGDQPPQPSGENAYCLLCHTEPGRTAPLGDGTELNVTIDLEQFKTSVHGDANREGSLGCVDCHGNRTYPHEGPPPANAREFTIQMAAACTGCHEEQAKTVPDTTHYTALAAGNFTAATCVDCHGAHDIRPPDVPRARISETCGQCHRVIFEQYRQSVHGQALFAGDPIVPTCIDCHTAHNIQHPTTAQFRNRSPELCASCHNDQALMKQYGISTNVFESYVTDFHGTTVELFEQEDPNVATNKAVCFDCHGAHNIARVDEAGKRAIRENLLATCQQCHPDATSNFPDAWVGHYPPTFESEPLLYSVKLFYRILIPGVLAGFALLIGTDIFRRIRQRGG